MSLGAWGRRGTLRLERRPELAPAPSTACQAARGQLALSGQGHTPFDSPAVDSSWGRAPAFMCQKLGAAIQVTKPAHRH